MECVASKFRIEQSILSNSTTIKKENSERERNSISVPPLARERFLRLAASPGRERILRSFLRLAAFVGFYEALLGCSRVESILQLFTYVYLVTRERVHCSNSAQLTPGLSTSRPVTEKALLNAPRPTDPKTI